MGKAFEAIADCASIIDEPATWQVIHGIGHFDIDEYELSTVSRGPNNFRY